MPGVFAIPEIAERPMASLAQPTWQQISLLTTNTSAGRPLLPATPPSPTPGKRPSSTAGDTSDFEPPQPVQATWRGRLTRVSEQVDVDPEGLVETVGNKPGVLDRQVKGDLKRFKEFIEYEGYETGARQGKVPAPRRNIALLRGPPP